MRKRIFGAFLALGLGLGLLAGGAVSASATPNEAIGLYTKTIGYGIPARHPGMASYYLGNLGKGVPNWASESCAVTQGCTFAGQNYGDVHAMWTGDQHLMVQKDATWLCFSAAVNSWTCYQPAEFPGFTPGAVKQAKGGAYVMGQVNPAAPVKIASPKPLGNVAGVLPTKVLYIGEENAGEVAFSKKVPTAKAYATMYGSSTAVRDQFVAPDRPSLPHYVVEGFGSPTAFGINDDAAPKKHPLHGVTIFGNAVAHGLTAKDYVQDATANCPLTDTGPYQKVRHDGGALAYDVDERALCAQIAVPMEPALSNDLAAGTLPNVGWIGLSVRDDGHAPGTPAAEDSELHALLGQIMAGADYQRGAVVIVIGTDEASGAKDPNVPVIAIHPSLLNTGAKNTEAMDQTGLYRMFLRFGGSTGLGDDALTGLHL